MSAPRPEAWRALALACTIVLLGGCARPGTTSQPATTAPGDFVGLQTASLLDVTPAARNQVMALVALSHVKIVREVVPWGQLEPHRDRYAFAALDGVVAAAARHHLRVFPAVDAAPYWALAPGMKAGPAQSAPPEDPVTLGRFMRRLVERYGPDGGFWRSRPGLPRLPITAWQVWNEPNLPQYWGGEPDPAAYVRMLGVVGRAIHRGDPSAVVVSAGIPNSRQGIPFAAWVRRFFAAGGRGTFDVFGLHAYAPSVTGALAATEQARALLRANGAAGVPIWITELGWADRGPKSPFTKSSRAQAADVQGAVAQLAAHRRALGLTRLVYFQLNDAGPVGYPGLGWGGYTGLLTTHGRPKPAWEAFLAAVRSLAR